MGRKKKNVDRCSVCGVKATQAFAGTTLICSNIVCYHTHIETMTVAIADEKNKKEVVQ